MDVNREKPEGVYTHISAGREARERGDLQVISGYVQEDRHCFNQRRKSRTLTEAFQIEGIIVIILGPRTFLQA